MWRANGCASYTRATIPALESHPSNAVPTHTDSPMAKAKHVSETPATQLLKKLGISFSEHPYEYVEHGGAKESARQLGVDLHRVAKTLIMEDERGHPLIIIMHGDREVSTKNLARQIGAKKIEPCKPEVAQRHSGYMVGGTSPAGTRRKMPVWIERGLLEFDTIYVNGGRRGYLISVDPKALADALEAQPVEVAIEKS